VKPTTVSLGLTLQLKDGRPFASWSACEGVEFAYYKLVRSSDSTVSWPTGSGDTLVAAVQPGSKTAAWDSGAPAGKKLWYRVFCVTSAKSVVRSSITAAIQTPAAAPAPSPCSFSLSASVLVANLVSTPQEGGAGVALDWTSCQSSGLVYYKVVRSAGLNPSYLPWTDGTVVVAVVEPAGTTAYVDHPAAGTWQYRVQAIGSADGMKVLLGQTAVASMTVP
jgi:hypothetical protein